MQQRSKLTIRKLGFCVEFAQQIFTFTDIRKWVGGGGGGERERASWLTITGIGRVKTPSYTAGLKPTAASLIFLLRWCEDTPRAEHPRGHGRRQTNQDTRRSFVQPEPLTFTHDTSVSKLKSKLKGHLERRKNKKNKKQENKTPSNLSLIFHFDLSSSLRDNAHIPIMEEFTQLYTLLWSLSHVKQNRFPEGWSSFVCSHTHARIKSTDTHWVTKLEVRDPSFFTSW